MVTLIPLNCYFSKRPNYPFVLPPDVMHKINIHYVLEDIKRIGNADITGISSCFVENSKLMRDEVYFSNNRIEIWISNFETHRIIMNFSFFNQTDLNDAKIDVLSLN